MSQKIELQHEKWVMCLSKNICGGDKVMLRKKKELKLLSRKLAGVIVATKKVNVASSPFSFWAADIWA